MEITDGKTTIESEEYVKKWADDWALGSDVWLEGELTEEDLRENIRKIYVKTGFAAPDVVEIVYSKNDFEKRIKQISKQNPHLQPIKPSLSNSCYCWASNLAYSDSGLCFLDPTPEYISMRKEVGEWRELLRGFSYVVFLSKLAVVLVKPRIHIEQKALHNDKGPAVVWKDGLGFYFLMGQHFDEDLWARVISGDMTYTEISQIKNADQRAVALELNKNALINEGSELLHADERGNELFVIRNQAVNKLYDVPEFYFVRMFDPVSTPERPRYHVEGVDPAVAKELNYNATACQAKLCGLTIDEYVHGMDFEG